MIGISTRESTCLYSLNGNIVSKVRGDLPPSSILIHHPSSHLFVVSYNIIYRLEGIDGELSEIHRLGKLLFSLYLEKRGSRKHDVAWPTLKFTFIRKLFVRKRLIVNRMIIAILISRQQHL